jgi:hypothetical protein
VNYLNLHTLAAARGDGLHPKLLELLGSLASASAAASNVEQLALHRGDMHIQAGPHPTKAAGLPLPDGVLRFAAERPSHQPKVGKSAVS